MKEELFYCTECWTPYPKDELVFNCICRIFGEREYRVVTKFGVKLVKQVDANCKNCSYKHSHIGETWI